MVAMRDMRYWVVTALFAVLVFPGCDNGQIVDSGNGSGEYNLREYFWPGAGTYTYSVIYDSDTTISRTIEITGMGDMSVSESPSTGGQYVSNYTVTDSGIICCFNESSLLGLYDMNLAVKADGHIECIAVPTENYVLAGMVDGSIHCLDVSTQEWETVYSRGEPVRKLVVDPSNTLRVFAQMDYEVQYTNDYTGAGTWGSLNKGNGNGAIKDIAVNNSGRLFIAYDEYVMHGKPGDDSFKRVQLPDTYESISGVSVSGNDDNVELYVVDDYQEVFVYLGSINNGELNLVGTRLDGGFLGHIQQLVSTRLQPYSAIVMTGDGLLFGRNLISQTWNTIGTPSYEYTSIALPSDGGGLYVGADCELYSLQQSGYLKLVTASTPFLKMWSIAANGDVIAITSERGLYVSTNMGADWVPQNDRLNIPVQKIGLNFAPVGFLADGETWVAGTMVDSWNNQVTITGHVQAHFDALYPPGLSREYQDVLVVQYAVEDIAGRPLFGYSYIQVYYAKGVGPVCVQQYNQMHNLVCTSYLD